MITELERTQNQSRREARAICAIVFPEKACQICGQYEKDGFYSQGKIIVHHLDLDSLNNAISNLQPCCLQCHSALHYQVSRKKWDAEVMLEAASSRPPQDHPTRAQAIQCF